ncbi:MAG: zinc ribbon domain-containing protein [Planctomycetota bacterium]|nr:MAG: zinc ribbon domain-containing protein [Planctomycetota bacterium]
MPFYDYRCTRCEHTFEELVADREQAVPCPECQGTTERLLPNTFAVGRARPKPAATPPCGNACPTPEACGLQ